MSRTKHSPAPWRVCEDPSGQLTIASSSGADDQVCSLPFQPGERSYTNDIANAKLLAAAPDLLSACGELLFAVEAVLEILGRDEQAGSPEIEQARAAVAKATAGDRR